MDLTECLEPGCNQLASQIESGGHWVDAADYDGADVELFLTKWMCTAGHRYHLVDESKTRITL